MVFLVGKFGSSSRFTDPNDQRSQFPLNRIKQALAKLNGFVIRKTKI